MQKRGSGRASASAATNTRRLLPPRPNPRLRRRDLALAVEGAVVLSE